MTADQSLLSGVQRRCAPSHRMLLAALLALCLCLTACGKGKTDADPEPTAVTETTAVQSTQPSVPEAEAEAETDAPASETGAVYDEAGVLTPEVIRQIDEQLTALSVRHRIRMAVVTTADLGGETPSAFAKAYFRSLYGKKASGMLVLINNDTLEDYIYTTGTCSDYLSGAEKNLAIAAATPDLVEGKYTSAVTSLLTLCEQLPSHVFDDSDTLSKAQIAAIEEAAQGCGGRVCVVLTAAALSEETTQESAPEDAAQRALQRAAEEHLQALGADTVLLLHTAEKSCAIAGAGEDTALCEELQGILESDAGSPFEDAAVHFYGALAEHSDT